MSWKLRVARPTDYLNSVADMYKKGLGFEILGAFKDHDGFDGVMLGHPNVGYHLEFTHHRGKSVGGAPTADHLLVFYMADEAAWHDQCRQMVDSGFKEVNSYNPYWDRHGKTFEDLDGYRVVLQKGDWPTTPTA